jgi:hypothetical protein
MADTLYDKENDARDHHEISKRAVIPPERLHEKPAESSDQPHIQIELIPISGLEKIYEREGEDCRRYSRHNEHHQRRKRLIIRYSGVLQALIENQGAYEKTYSNSILCLDKLTGILRVRNIDQKKQCSKHDRGDYCYT